MLLDLLSSSNQVSYNIVVAQTFGLQAAVYLSELMTIFEKAIRKKKIEEIDGIQYFTISRKYITDRTTITAKEQKAIDAKLSDLHIIRLKADTKDTLNLDINLLASLLGTELDTSVLQNISRITKIKTKAEKDAEKLTGQVMNARKAVQTTNPELRTAWYGWIDAVAERYNYINKNIVIAAEEAVDAAANRNLDVALAIIAENIEGYKTMEYAINKYLTKHPINSFVPEAQTIIKTTGERF